jgi:hypothetical protein
LGYFRAVRQLGIGSLHIAHTTKNGDQAEYRPFGSAFWHNSARCTWFVKQAGTEEDGRVVMIGLYNRKTNLGPQRRPIGFRVCFDDQRTTYTRVDIQDVAELAAAMPLWQRIIAEVRSGPKTYLQLAEALEQKVDSVEKAVKRKGGVFTRVTGPDGIHRVALLEMRPAA